MKLFKRIGPGLLLLGLLCCLSCQTTDIQPIVIDFSAAKTPAPTVTPTLVPPPRPTPTVAAPPAVPAAVPAPPAARDDRSAVAAPEGVARRRVDACNRRDIEELAALYAPDARIYEPPERLRDSGIAAIRADYAGRFASSKTTVTVGERMTEGGYVVEREVETDGSGRSRSALVISQVRDGKIVTQWILR